MEKKINIAEILNGCPQGLKLYSPIFGNVYLSGIRPHLGVIVKTSNNQKKEFLYDGRFGINGECMLFPSNENRDWSTFKRPFNMFKDGDVVRSNDNFVAFIYKERINTSLVISHFTLYARGMGFCKNNCIALKEDEIVFATEEEKRKLFDAIEEHGYKWNAETKTLEKLTEPKFKDGDIISDSMGTCIFKGEGGIKGTVNYYCGISHDYFRVKDDKGSPNGHYGNIVDYRLATEEEKRKLFDAIKEHGYKWNAETKTLEKMVESKEEVDDRIVMSGIYFDRENYADEVELRLGNYEIETRNGKTYAVFKNQEAKELKPKFKVGDRVRLKSKPNYVYTINSLTWDDNNKLAYRLLPDNDKHLIVISLITQDEYELVPDKFDFSTLIPFESKVLVRGNGYCLWKPATFGFFNDGYFYVLGGNAYKQCIPYEGNEHLRGNTDDCDEYFKVWK